MDLTADRDVLRLALGRLVSLLALLSLLASGYAADHAFLRSFGGKWVVNYRPAGVARDSAGNLYVADQDNCRIVKYSPSGPVLAKWGTYGTGNGQFRAPWGVAIGPGDVVYVADTLNACIQKFASDGRFLKRWGTDGTANGQLDRPIGVAVNAGGAVFVAEFGNCRISKFTADGTFITKWTNGGVEGGRFNNLYDLTVGADGFIYVGDWYGCSVLKLDANGALQGSFGLSGTLGSNSWPAGLEADADGNVYVAVNTKGCLLKFNNKQQVVATWGAPGSADAQFQSPTGLARDTSGNLYVGDSMNYRLQKLSKTGGFLARWLCREDQTGKFAGVGGIAFDSADRVYVADPGNNRVQVFTKTGSFLRQFGTRGTGNGQFRQPGDLLMDAANNLYVADTGNARIDKFTSAGSFLTHWGEFGTGNGQFHCPTGLGLGTDGNLLVSDGGWGFYVASNDRVQTFTSTGSYVNQWGTGGSGGGQLDWPNGVAAGPDGTVYVAEQDNNRVQRFTALGSSLGTWGSAGSANGQFDEPGDLAVDTAGNVYVCDYGNSRVQVFNATGTFLGVFGGYGTGNGQFFMPSGLAVADDGTVFVADSGNHRVQVFMSGVAPQVTSYLPRGTGVARNTDLVLRFSVAMNHQSVQQNLYLNGKPLSGGLFTWAGLKLTYNPATDFAAGKRQQVKLAWQAKSKAGVPLGVDKTWSFTTAAAPSVVALSAAPTAAGAQISVRLTEAAAVTVTIRNLAGRVVATLPSQSLPAGLRTLLWSGRTTAGPTAPRGYYIVEVIAQADDGSRAQALVPLHLQPH